jgi:hypothetical protein
MATGFIDALSEDKYCLGAYGVPQKTKDVAEKRKPMHSGVSKRAVVCVKK